MRGNRYGADVVRLADAAERDLGQAALPIGSDESERSGAFGVDQSGGDRLEPEATRSEFGRQDAGHAGGLATSWFLTAPDSEAAGRLVGRVSLLPG